jgi:hypothetical protein
MPEFIITISYPHGYTEHRCGHDTRHTKRVIAGFRGRYPSATYAVHRIGTTEDVSGDFAKRS